MDDIRSCGADWASYHLSHFRSYAELQVEIDHRNATLLRTRYVDQRGQKCAGILDGGIGDANYGCVILKNEIVELLRSEILSLEGGTFISPGRQP